LSRARNAGVRVARGQIIAFTDDDTLASQEWLLEIHKAFRDYPDAAIVGGSVLPLWEAPRPKWLTTELEWMLALVDFGGDIRRLATPCLVGANFACRKNVLAGEEPFDTALGRVGTRLFGGEETEVQRQALRIGREVYYAPGALIHHVIGPDRMRKSYFYRIAFDHGYSFGAHRQRIPDVPVWRGVRRSLLRTTTYLGKRRTLVAQLRCVASLGFLVGFLSTAQFQSAGNLELEAKRRPRRRMWGES
jgi:GT2 family glycosyltransferase